MVLNRRFKNDKGEYETDFISCQAWRQTAEFVAKYFSKGSMICIDGTLRTGSYQDKNHSDVTHYTTDVLVETVEFCGGKKEQEPEYKENIDQSVQKTGSLADFEEILSDGDVPF